MNYQALYRKYRPQRFDEVVGQDHVTETLAREVIEGKVAHAYLFSGPRGTGKTTSARLLAKSLNCPDRAPDGEPCNVCPSCVGITNGTSLDVIELDAASHNKVEDVREMRVNVSTVAAAPGARRVYILDEAHMLSRAASNALLKTLEEPPEHVVFILATTEPYKLLDTIRSRTQRFDFQPVSTEILIDYLAKISDSEGFSYDHAALGAVTSHAGGSVRDAMSLLEQVAALGSGVVTSAGVSKALGIADADSYGRLMDSIHGADAAGALSLIAEIASQGADLRRFVSDAVGFLRGVFLAQYTGNIEEVANESRETIEHWKRYASVMTRAEVLRAIDTLSDALVQLRSGREERLVVEVAVMKLARPEIVEDLEALTVRLDRVERELREIKRGTPPVASSPRSEDSGEPDRPFVTTAPSPQRHETEPRESGAEESKAEEQESKEPEAEEPEAEHKDRAVSLTFGDFEKAWPAIMATIRQDVGPRRHALLREARPVAVDNGIVQFEVAAHMHFHLEQLKADTGIEQAIVTAGMDHLGRPIRVAFRSADSTEEHRTEQVERAPDKDTLVAAEDDSAPDPAAVVLDILGGEIVADSNETAE
ncbi:MAG: DNA polymerase III subunit gamma/tau [Actinomycetia bacterium]|nr:DNA polymerase III subunit gamma/tau [Actinomycetes bacterium]